MRSKSDRVPRNRGDRVAAQAVTVAQGRPFDDRDAAAVRAHRLRDLRARGAPRRTRVGPPDRLLLRPVKGRAPPSREIVGVVGDVRQDGVSRRPIAQMYAPHVQSTCGFARFFVRLDGGGSVAASSLQRVVSSVDPLRPVRDVLATGEIVRSSTARERAMTWMLFSLQSLLATIGLYGVTAAATRSRELAIRAAVGAAPGRARSSHPGSRSGDGHGGSGGWGAAAVWPRRMGWALCSLRDTAARFADLCRDSHSADRDRSDRHLHPSLPRPRHESGTGHSDRITADRTLL